VTKIGNKLYGYKKEEVSKIPTIKDGCQQRKRIIKIMDAIKFVGLGPLQDQVIHIFLFFSNSITHTGRARNIRSILHEI
jgi:hypothetical protein